MNWLNIWQKDFRLQLLLLPLLLLLSDVIKSFSPLTFTHSVFTLRFRANIIWQWVENSIIAITFDYPELSSHLDPSTIRDWRPINNIIQCYSWPLYICCAYNIFAVVWGNLFSHSCFFLLFSLPLLPRFRICNFVAMEFTLFSLLLHTITWRTRAYVISFCTITIGQTTQFYGTFTDFIQIVWNSISSIFNSNFFSWFQKNQYLHFPFFRNCHKSEANLTVLILKCRHKWLKYEAFKHSDTKSGNKLWMVSLKNERTPDYLSIETHIFHQLVTVRRNI